MTTYDPALEGMVNEARAVSCVDWLTREGHLDKLKRSGQNYAGPCPKCGGTDRFGVDAAQDKWNCRGCGIGGNDAISLVMMLWPMKGKTAGQQFIEACELITGRKRGDVMSQAEIDAREKALAEKKAKQEKDSARRREEARESGYRMWKRGEPPADHIATYFGIRKINLTVDQVAIGKALRQVDDLEYWHDMAEPGAKRSDMQCIHRGPAMLGAVQWSDDKFGAVHRTWLDPNGKRGKAVIIRPGPEPEALDNKKVMGSLGDGAIRLITPANADRMVIGEGIETTATVAGAEADPRTAYWVGVSLGHMAGRAGRDPETGKRIENEPDLEDLKAFLVPEWVRELVILGDGDSDPLKTKAAVTRCAKRAKRLRPSIVVKIAWPGIRGDFNDLGQLGEQET